MIDIDIRSNLKEITRSLDALVSKQIPFAIAQAINTTAARVQAAEEANIKAKFKNPTPFTQKSVGLSKARKSNPVAKVFIKGIAAAYLEPYEDGGVHKLSSKALLNPKDIRLNSYGQLPKAALANLKARPDVFIGAITTSSGETVNGVWQRPTNVKRVTLLGKNGKKLRGLNKADLKSANPRGHLKLLIRFGDALPVKTQLGFGSTAQAIVARYLAADFQAALAQAIKTAK